MIARDAQTSQAGQALAVFALRPLPRRRLTLSALFLWLATRPRRDREEDATRGRDILVAEGGFYLAKRFVHVPGGAAGKGTTPYYYFPWADIASWKVVPADAQYAFSYYEVEMTSGGRRTYLRLHCTFVEESDEKRFLALVGARAPQPRR